jgi:hypothetical protein
MNVRNIFKKESQLSFTVKLGMVKVV